MNTLMSLHMYGDWGLVVLRVCLGIVFLTHGIPKLKDPKGMAGPFSLGFIVLIGLMESLGAVSVLLGLLTQVGALLIAVVMVGATYMKITKWNIPFSKQGIMGWEFDFMLFGTAVCLLFIGGGEYALDRMWWGL